MIKRAIYKFFVAGIILFSCSSKKAELDEPGKLSSSQQLEIKVLGDSCYEVDDYQNAISYYNQAIDLGADIGETYYRRGYSFIQVGKRDSAKIDLEQAIVLEYRVSEAYFLLGTIEFLNGRCAFAIPYFKKCLELDPTHIECRKMLNACEKL